MTRKFKRSVLIRHVLMLTAIPLVLMGTGYALFSQQLSVDADANKPDYTASQNLLLTYTRSVTPQGQSWTYNIGVTIKNNGTSAVSAWQATFSLPGDYSNVSCTNATCSQASGVNTAVNTGTNGTIAAGGTVTFNFSFRSGSQTYVFTAITVSGTLPPTYQTVTGLTVLAVAGARTKAGKWYTWPYTFTVTNASGQNLAGWRILIPWNTSSNQVASMPTTVNYVQAASQLTIMSKQAINSGTNFQFVANLSSTSSTWVMTGYTVEGQL